MDESIFIGCAFGLFVFVLAGSALAVASFIRLRGLEQRLRELESRVDDGADPAGRKSRPGEQAAPQQEVRPQAPEVGGPKPPPAAPQERRPFDLESLIAGQWLNRIGIVAMLLGTSFFLKFAFDNDWIGPTGRVAIGLLAGTGLILASQWFVKRGLHYFSEGITALGGGVLFLSLYAAWDFYQLIPQGAAFGGMILVTAGLAALAKGRDSQRLAVLALLGGLLTPGLLSTGVDSQTTLFVYLSVLAAGFLALAWSNSWRWIAPIALAGVILYFFTWYDQFYESAKLLPTLCYATLFFGLFAGHSALRAQRASSLRLEEAGLALANAAWFGVSLHSMLHDDHRWWLTGAVLVLAVIHLLLARHASVAATRYVFAGLALAFATAAIPIRLDGEWIRTAFAIEGAALVWAGFRADVKALRLTGLALLVVITGLLLDASRTTERFLLNERFLAFLATVAALGCAYYWARARRASMRPAEQKIFDIAGVAANGIAVWGLSEEVWRVLGNSGGRLDSDFAQQLGLSLLWTVCGSLLIAVGIGRRSKGLRWQGLILIGLTIVKVFLFDLSFLEKGYRIVSFIVLGIVLLLLSFFYQRGLSSDRGSSEP